MAFVPRSVRPALWGALLSLAIGCGGASPQAQRAAGEEAYVAYCAACHELGQGIGPVLSPDVIDDRVTAQRLFEYNRDRMPYNAGGILTDEKYWAITAYLVVRGGFMPADSIVLGPRNAEAFVLGVHH